MFTTKAFAIPHLRTIICGTGAGGFLGKWFIKINDRMVVRGIDNLDYHTPRILIDIWKKYKEEFPTPDNLTTTVYHFGFSEEDNLIHECELPENFVFPIDIKKMMDEQRNLQSTKPIEERVFIGGEIQIHHLTKNGLSIYTWARFDDYDVTEQAIYNNCDSQNSS
jgi:hypothetical protein